MTEDAVPPLLPVSSSRDGGRYTLQSVLGRGSTGEVYLAHDERLRRQVAIKRIRAAGGNEAHLRTRLEQEARVLAQLGHPSIVQVFDIFEDADGTWLVMELVVGRTLAQLVAEQPLDIDATLRHGMAIAAALDTAHQKGIVHRALKVENVMISTSGELKLLAFGLAGPMPPEPARDLPVDARSDLFSLGGLLYEVLSGSPPFAGAAAPPGRPSAHRQTSLVELPGLAEVIPPALSALIDELLEEAVEQRPSSAAEVLDRLAAIAAARPRAVTQQRTQAAPDRPSPAAAPAPPGDRATEPAEVAGRGAPESPSRRRYRYLALAGLGGAVAAVLAVLLLGGGERPPAPEAGPPLAASGVNLAGSQRDPKAEYERGMALLRNFHRPGTTKEAGAIFQRLLRADARSAAAYAGLARAYWLEYKLTDVAGRDAVLLQQAQAAAEQAVALDERLVDARVSRGLVALELSQVEQAEQDLQAALALNRKSAAAHAGMAWLHRGRDHLAKAEASFREALALEPDNREFYDDLGAVLVQLGRYQDAIPLFEKSIALAPDSAYGYSNLGGLYVMLGRYDEAAQRLQDALKIRPSSYLYRNLGTALFAQGRYGPSATAFERALAMGGGAHDYMSWANLADAYRQLPDSTVKAREHYDRAIELLDSELARSPQDPTLLSRRAMFLAKRGDCARSDAGLASLTNAREPPLYALFRMAVTLEICGHRQRAIDMLDRALGRGFSPAEIESDPDLRALRADPAFQRMLQRSSSSAAQPGAGPH